MAPPSRPRLAGHVLARRYTDGEGRRERVLLHDKDSGELLELSPRDWVILSLADGTRDLEGIALGAAREGAPTSIEALLRFFTELHGAGLLEGGAAPLAGGDDEPQAVVDPGRPLDVLADYSLTCDGSGSCCRFYGSVIFGPAEAALARGLLPLVRGGGAREDRVFSPDRGTGPTGGLAVTACEGRCAYLGDSGRCRLHAIGGPAAKPVGCNTFPASFVDDGEAVRVSVSVECACVLASVGRAGGSSLVAGGARVRGDLDPVIHVTRLAEVIAVSREKTASRAELVAWSRAFAAMPPPAEAASFAWRLAAAIEEDGLAPSTIERARRGSSAPAEAELTPWIAALDARVRRFSKRDEAWRSPRDLTLRTARWMALATASLLQPGAIAAAVDVPLAAEGEAFYLRALAHGHGLAGELPLAAGLRDRCVRLVVGRALAVVLAVEDPQELDPACAEPLALVEAMLRGHGLGAYAADVRA